MFDKLISFSIRNKLVVGFFTVALIIWGINSFKQIPIDAVPDITTNQVQIITQSPTLATQEVEQFITFPIELAMANIPDVDEIRSISRFGISVITVVFEEHVDIYLARQLISEQLKIAEAEIPSQFGKPTLGPITTGLGEVYQYVLHAAEGYDSLYTDMYLRTIHDWIVKRQLAGTPGVIEVSGWGGHLKQYEVAVDPDKINSLGVTINEIFDALENNNENSGGSYIEKRYNTYFLRGQGLVSNLEDIGNIVIKSTDGLPLLIRDVAKVGYGSAPRYGAITWNGHGEVVGGQALMLKGENSYEVVSRIKERMAEIEKSLPEGVVIEPFLDRSKLIGRAINTVRTNLIEGGLIVILVLVLLLGNFRGGLIVASVIPLSLLFAIGMMNFFGVSANLMSLGAIDFGLVVDGSVIIVEAIIFRLHSGFAGQRLDRNKMDLEVGTAAKKIRNSAAFGEIIILIVYLPILALVGIEGKMFKPMAQTVSFAIAGALILSLTYVPMMCSQFLNTRISNKATFSDRIINAAQKIYSPVLNKTLKRSNLVVLIAVIAFGMSVFTFNRMGGEFIPTLEEGDFALHQILPTGSSLSQSVEVSEKIQKTLLSNFPEVENVVSKIGTSEIPTDPMPIEVGDIMVTMKPKNEWTSASTKEEMFEKMEIELNKIPGVEYEFTQPIQMRFNELIAGVREDIAIKIYGESMDVLARKAEDVEKLISGIDGVGDLRVEQTEGLPQIVVKYKRNRIAQYGLNIKDVNRTLRTAFAGEVAGQVFEGERRFDLAVRLEHSKRQGIDDVRNLYIPIPNGANVPLSELASIEFVDGPVQISREDAKRKIVVGVNARNRDTESLVEEIKQVLDAKLDLPPGYSIRFGGQYQNLKEAKARLYVAAPIALLLIFVLLFVTFKSVKQALLIFTAIPFSAIGGVYALYFRGLPFSISAGIGFIALSGVAVLNGIVLIGYFNRLKSEGMTNVRDRIIKGTQVRLRPVLMTAAVAALGFLPMALSTNAGAEVQKPLATVVIGGLITATLLTLLVLPILYEKFEKISLLKMKNQNKTVLSLFLVFAFIGLSSKPSSAQSDTLFLNLDGMVAEVSRSWLTRPAVLELEKEIEMKKTVFGLEPTQVQWAQGELNAQAFDYQFQVSQSFELPTYYKRKKQLLESKVELAEQKQTAYYIMLEKKLRREWQTWLYYKQLEKELSEKLAFYDTLLSAQQKKVNLGESSEMDLLYVKQKRDHVAVSLQQASLKTAEQLVRLQLFFDIEKEVVYVAEDFKPLNMPNLPDSASLELMEQKLLSTMTNAQIAEYKLQKSQTLPNLNLGYINQQIEGVANLQAIQFGVGIPLNARSQKAKRDAQVIAIEQSSQQRVVDELRINSQFYANVIQANNYYRAIDNYYSNQLSISKSLKTKIHGSYMAGEIDVFRYTILMEEVREKDLEYLFNVLMYNMTIIEIQSQLGDFN